MDVVPGAALDRRVFAQDRCLGPRAV